jgi:geranylgeranyl diphosphate synthase type I
MTPSEPVVAPSSLYPFVARLDARLSGLLDEEATRWAALDPDLAAPLSSLRQLVLAGGKRLRPAFCYWAFLGTGGDPDDPRIINAAAALEMLHTSALLHDDVMDNSTQRRGAEALHTAFGRRHGAAGWRGDSDRFGDGVAILVGNLAFVYADLLLGRCPPSALTIWNEMRLEVNVGQYLDLAGTASGQATRASARRICQYKSGRYTIERPLHLGAALAEPSGWLNVLKLLSAYGAPLGEAFQLRDDLLGAFGEANVTGKPVGEDLREGKPTLLYALARQLARGAEAQLLEARYGSPDLSGSEVADIQAILDSTGARAEVEATVERLVSEAMKAAGELPLRDTARAALMELARFVGGRDR